MALMTHEESVKKIAQITANFVEDFLDANSSRCLDDEEDRMAVGKYLADKLLPAATELARAAMGLEENKN